MTPDLVIAVLAATLTAATPLLFAGIGELVVERSGLLNLGVEGMMLVGAVTAFAVSVATGSAAAGIAASMLVGAVLGLAAAVLVVTVRADQVVTGLTIVILGDGLSRFFGQSLVGVSGAALLSPVPVPLLADIPWIGPIFFRQNLLVYLSYILVPAVWYFMYRTRPGLALRATGERPSAADLGGHNVFLIRYLALAFGSAMAGLAGGFLALGYLNAWVEGISAGRGWVALALVILAGWHPIRLIGGAYLFGFAYIMAFQIQTFGGVFQEVSTYLVQMFPYLLAIVVLAIMGRRFRRHRVGPPAALALPYVREERS